MKTEQASDASTASISAWRAAMGFSQREAANALGCSRTALARWEDGEARTPKYITLACAAVALGIAAGGITDADEDH